jgi:hypothetical protein
VTERPTRSSQINRFLEGSCRVPDHAELKGHDAHSYLEKRTPAVALSA